MLVIRRYIYLCWGIIFLAAVSGCGKPAPGSPLDVAERFTAASGYEAKIAYLSKGSRELLDRAVREKIVTRDDSSLFPPLVPGTSWKVFKDDRGTDTRTMQVRITDHPVLNQVGLVVPLVFIRENSSWKIDLTEDIAQRKRQPLPDIEKYLRNRESGEGKAEAQ